MSLPHEQPTPEWLANIPANHPIETEFIPGNVAPFKRTIAELWEQLAAAQARIAELEAQLAEKESERSESYTVADNLTRLLTAERAAHLATQRSLVRLADACDRVQDWHDTRIGDALYLDIVEETRAAVAKADKPKN